MTRIMFPKLTKMKIPRLSPFQLLSVRLALRPTDVPVYTSEPDGYIKTIFEEVLAWKF